MAGTFPSANFTAMDFQSNTNTRVTTSISGRTQRAQAAGQFFSFKLQSVPLTRTEFNAINAFITNQKGRLESFTVVPPIVGSTSGTASGTATITDTFAQGSTTVRANGASGTLKAGDYIKFSNHDKVYMLTADVNMDASSEDYLEIFPALTAEINNSTTVTYDDVPFKVFFNTDQHKYTVSTTGLIRYEIEVREEL